MSLFQENWENFSLFYVNALWLDKAVDCSNNGQYFAI